MNLTDLISKLESAPGPTQNLDIEIFKLVHPDANLWRTDWPSYTSSLDAALTLVPEGRGWNVAHLSFVGPKPTACIDVFPRCDGATPALALCIAALKAREGLRP